MVGKFCRVMVALAVVFAVFGMLAPSGYSEDIKIGYVDLRRAFYEYEKAKDMESQLSDLTEERKTERTKKIEAITKMREEAELLSGDARVKKEKGIDNKLTELQGFDRDVRQQLLNRKNDMFREVIEDIQKVVDILGAKEGYSYILDSRNIMYAQETYDLTDRIVGQLNKK